MDNALSQYRAFYRALVRFENEFPYKVKPNCPTVLTNVRKIHYIIQPDDDDFTEHRSERVIQKLCLVLKVTQRVLTGIPRFVRPGELWWVRAKSNNLSLYSSMVRMSLVGLRLDSSEESSSGIGGLNFVEIETKRLIDNGLLQDLSQLMDILG